MKKIRSFNSLGKMKDVKSEFKTMKDDERRYHRKER